MKTITDYLPKKVMDVHHISGRIPMQVYKEIKKLMREKNVNCNELLTACLTHLIDQDKEMKKNKNAQ